MDYQWTKKARETKLKSFERAYFDKRFYNNFKMSRIPIWINSYGYWLRKENSHQLPKYYRVFKRGTLVMVNFGVQLGAEFSGNHFAVVLNRNDNKYSPVLTVVPLSSKEKRWYANLGYEVLQDIKKLFDQRQRESDDLLNNLQKTAKGIIENLKHTSYNFTSEESQILLKVRFAEHGGNQTATFNLGKNNPWVDDQLSKLELISDISKYKNISHYHDTLVHLNDVNNEMMIEFNNANRLIGALESLLDKAKRFNKPTFANVRNITTISKLKIIKFSSFNISENINISPQGMTNIESKIENTI
ncbi:type II toxin-antitoxin system PemK/MazF family toxin [uncultured Secundilactobacillus sp.]|uniref:type II toxin-antitoxin system PemK/MazF family toxin n=1 Tax=uncultured Secundilactobacillus sp. TaxID=2813935 RepID=UPI00258496C0|nr:type II toxin-antitoxin system PemK/MazF family toxin [uncultured Secundilactobacillus sp.]